MLIRDHIALGAAVTLLTLGAPTARTVAAQQASTDSTLNVADPAAHGAGLLAAARTALGGARLDAVQRIEAKGTFRRAAGDRSTDGDFEIRFDRPSRYRLDESSGEAGGVITERTQVLNGTEVWDENSGGGDAFGGWRGGRFGGRAGGAPAEGAAGAAAQPAIDPERIREIQRRSRQADVAHLMLAWFMTTPDPVRWVGTAEAPDGTADVIEVQPAEGAATRVFLDTRTHLPLMLTWQGANRGGMRRGAGGQGGPAGPGGVDAGRGPGGGGPARAAASPGAAAGEARGAGAPGARAGGEGRGDAQQATFEMHLSDYRTVNGVQLPFVISRGVNGEASEALTVKSYKLNPTFKANLFEKKS